MNTLTGFNTAEQIIAALYNTSEFQSYKPGFNTIKINTSKSNTLDITNIENSHVGFNVLIPPPEINYSVAIVGGIDNSGGVLVIGPHVSKIDIGNKNCITNISGAFNASTLNISTINTSTITTSSIITQNINASGTLTIGELSDIVNLGNSSGTVNINGELNAQYIDSSGDVLNIGLFSNKIELGNQGKNININGIVNAYDTINANLEIITPSIDNPENDLVIGELAALTTIGRTTTNVRMKNALINYIDSYATNENLYIGYKNTSTVIIGNNSNVYLNGNVFTTNIRNIPINTAGLSINSSKLNFNVSNIALNGINGARGEVITVDSSGNAVWGTSGGSLTLSQVTNYGNFTNTPIIATDDLHYNTFAPSYIYLRELNTNESLTINKDGITVTDINFNTNISAGGINTPILSLQNGNITNNLSVNTITANKVNTSNLSVSGTIITNILNASSATLQNGYITNNLSVANTVSTNILNASTATLQNGYITNNLSVNTITANKVNTSNLSVSGTIITNILNASTATLENGYITNNLSVTGIINAYNINTDTKIDVSGQVVFNTPPHIPDPMFGNDAASKGYVDSLVGQYSGGLNLFLNNSLISDVLDPSNNTCKLLLSTVDDAASSDIHTTITSDDNYLINSFITDVNYPGIVSLPQGLWSMTVYSDISSVSTGIMNYRFVLYKYSNNNFIHIATSTPSDDVNALYGNVGSPTAYHMQAIITEQTLLVTDRLAIILYAQSSGVPPGSILKTCFEGEFYSYVQTTLNAGTNLLGSSNTWTGNNNFTISLTAPTLDQSDNSTNAATTAYVTRAINNLSTSDNEWKGINNFSSLNVSVNASIYNASITNLSVSNINGTNASITNLSVSNSTINNITTQTIDSNTSLTIGATTATYINIGRENVNVNMSIANVSNINTPTIDTTGALIIGPTNATSINIGKAAVPVNMSILNTPNIDTTGALIIGPTNATSINIGKVAVPVNMSIANTSNVNTPNIDIGVTGALIIGPTNATSINIGKTNVSVNMSIANASTINTPNIDIGVTGALIIGPTNATSINIGKTNVSVNMSIANASTVNTPTLDRGVAGALIIGPTNATSINIGKTNVSVNMSIANASTVNTPTLDRGDAGVLIIGPTNATSINIGKTNVSVNMSIANVSTINTPNIDTTGALIIGPTNATSINIGKTNVSVNMSIANASTVNTPTLDRGVAGALIIGPTNATSINIGKTNVSVNMSIANASSVNTQTLDRGDAGILIIGPTNATSINIGKTNVSVNMSIANASTINTPNIDTTGALIIGPTNATSINIGKTNVSVNMSIANASTVNTPTLDRGNAGALIIGPTNATSINIGKTNVSVNMSIANASTVNTPTLDRGDAGLLIIGPTNATSINIGKTNVSVNMSIVNASIINTPNIDTTGLLIIGPTNATSINIGKTNVSVNMSIANVSTINTPNIDTTGALIIGPTNATSINIGKENVPVNASVIYTPTLDSDINGLLKIGVSNASDITIGNADSITYIYGDFKPIYLYTNFINSSNNTNSISLYIDNINGDANILTGTLRTGTTNMLTGRGINTFNLGGINTTTNISGSVVNFNSSINNFINLSVRNISIVNASITNLSVNNASIINASINNASIINASITNLSASNAFLYNTITPNIDATNTDLTIGGSTATSIILGKTTTATNILGKIKLGGSLGTSGQVLTTNGDSSTPSWTDLPATWSGQALSNLNMSIYTIYSNAINTSTQLNISGQVVFNTPPHIPDPILGNDAASKGYVDSLVGQYGGSLNLFMNYNSEPDPIISGYYKLNTTTTSATTQYIDTLTNGTEQLVTSFITNTLNITEIPSGAWTTNLNGYTGDKTIVVNYISRVYIRTLAGVETQIGTGATSSAINTTVVGDYYCNAVLPLTSLLLTDRIVVKIYVLRSGGSSNTTIRTYFQGTYYSYVSSSLNAGTTLLSSNNIWTGTNDFSAVGIKTTTIDSSSTLDIGRTTQTTMNIGRSGITTNWYGSNIVNGSFRSDTITTNNISGVDSACQLWSNVTTGAATILNSTTRTAQTDILTGTSTKTVNFGGAATTTNWYGIMNFNSTANNFTNAITATTLDSATTISIGPTNATSINIGKTNVSVNMSIANVSTINTQTLDRGAAGALIIGPTNATSINIGKASVPVNMSVVNTPSIDIGVADALIIGLTNATSVNIGKTNVSVNMSIANVSTINTQTLDRGVAGALIIGPTNATSINIGKASVPVNMSVLNTPTIDTTGALIIGPTNATSINIGKTNVSVNMSIANVSTINTQILDRGAAGALIIGPTNATSINIGKTSVPVNMSIANTSNVNTPTIDIGVTGALIIGSTNATSINIGKTSVPVNMSVLNTPTIDIGVAGALIIGPTNATSINIGKTNVSVNMSIANVSTINTPSIDTTGTLIIGASNATSINIGKANVSVNMSIANVSTVNTPSIDTTGALIIGAVNATSINIGKANVSVNMSIANASVVNTPSLDTTGTLIIGASNATSINIGKANVSVNMSIANVSVLNTSAINGTNMNIISTTYITSKASSYIDYYAPNHFWNDAVGGLKFCKLSFSNASISQVYYASGGATSTGYTEWTPGSTPGIFDTGIYSVTAGTVNISSPTINIGKSNSIINMSRLNASEINTPLINSSTGTITIGSTNQTDNNHQSNNHYIYNAAKTQYKKNFWSGYASMVEQYFVDTSNAGVSSLYFQMYGNATTNGGVCEYVGGIFKLFSANYNEFNSPAHYLRDVVGGSGLYQVIGYSTNTVYTNIVADSANPTIQSGSIVWTPGSTPTVSNTGTCTINCGTLNIGSATATTNILGYLKIANSAGTAGQVLTSNGNNTIPTWNSLSSIGFGWVGTANSNLSMGVYNINGTNMNIISTTYITTKATSYIDYFAPKHFWNAVGGSKYCNISFSNTSISQVYWANGGETQSGYTEWAPGLTPGTPNTGIYSIISETTNISSNIIILGGPTSTVNTSTINTTTLDSAGALNIGTTNQTALTIGKTTNTTEIKGSTIKLNINSDFGATGSVLKSGGSGATATWGSYWNGIATSNLSMGTNPIICDTINASATSLTIGGGVTSQGVTLGKALTTTNILGNLQIAGSAGALNQVLRSNGTTAEWVNYGTATANLAMGIYSITGTSMDSGTTLSLGTTTATTTTLGRTTNTATNINGTTVGITGTTSITLSGATTINSTLTNDTIDSSTTAIGMSLWTSNLTGVANILTGTTRSGTTNMLTSTNNNILNLGGRSSTNGMTLNLEGVAANFKSTANTFTNRITAPGVDTTGTLSIGTTNATSINIGRSGATLNISATNLNLNSATEIDINTPLYPTYEYNASSGTNVAGSIGYVYNQSTTGSGSFNLGGAYKECNSITSIPVGVYFVDARVTLNPGTTFSYTALGVGPTTASLAGASCQTNHCYNYSGVGNPLLFTTGIYRQTTAGAVYFNVGLIGTGTWTLTTSVLRFVRIA